VFFVVKKMNSKGNILAIDQGTTNTKALLINKRGEVVSRASRPVAVRYPQAAWVEQDADAIWQSVREAMDDCLAGAGEPNLAAIAITNQRESVTLWERESGRPAGPVVVWQCRRTADFCAGLRAQGLADGVAQRTGLALDPMFSASKVRWLLDQAEDGHKRAERGELLAGTMDSWVLWNLTGGKAHACDVTNASRTQLMDIFSLQWSDELLAMFGVPHAALPTIHPSSHAFGASVACGRLPAGVPVFSLIGDSHAALFGQAGFRPGSVKATYGTGSSLMTPTPAPIISQHGLSTTVAWALDRDRVTYALEGNILVTGAAVQWLANFLGLKNADDVAALAASVNDSAGLYLVPAFVGLGAPHWNDTARGLIGGMTFGTTSAHLARATLESIAYQVRDVFDLMQAEAGAAHAAGFELKTLLADGGASKNDALMQFQSDIIGCPVLRATSSDASALGAAYLAGLAGGIWRDVNEIEQLPRLREQFEPTMPAQERENRYAGWRTTVARATFEQTPDP
jgi:glycerol kinase